ncbi:chromosomal replication initiation protein DnaA [Alkalispirochaeta sphaeroplastigenens]|uniref:Chromosomal replication initiator protein DnaA n=1 Tax=Alkalispirochaeta sphaeroplastigenens TaxID=1187066 RepID=A0A2S4K0T3_9SPIO|nr:chromosomal replication initiator protein DnaA [Alkalispirochaeta sphaeroplastigenens]POR05368.1 chromosomal replication initiation protein DnaA [Alkalispirochaeta sphaeroplastigenens]
MSEWQGNRVFWDEALKIIQQQISEQEYVMWFQQIEYTESDEDSITVTVPSSFYRDQVKQRYLDLIMKTLRELSGRSFQIHFSITKTELVQEKSRQDSSEDLPEKPGGPSPREREKKPGNTLPAPGLNEEYTFTNFVVGDNNRFAANAAIAIAKNPGTTYNPCLIYGGVGLGKTHLLQSIGNAVWQEKDEAKIVYVTAEDFTNEFIRSIQENKTHLFKNKYRKADVLLIDDIHFLQKKHETQEELFHTFNALFDAKKQMIFTSDRPVSEIKDITERLQNRFTRGLTVDLQPPQMETAVAILKKKAEKQGVYVANDVINLICQKITTNVRDLEAALTRIIAYAELVNKEVSLEVAQRQLKDFFSSPTQNNITVDIIQRVVADYFNLSSNELKGKKRTRQVAFPRQMAMYITREITEASMTDVGLEFGGRDHTTVMHACQRISSRMRTDPTIEDIIQTLIRKIKEEGSRA